MDAARFDPVGRRTAAAAPLNSGFAIAIAIVNEISPTFLAS